MFGRSALNSLKYARKHLYYRADTYVLAATVNSGARFVMTCKSAASTALIALREAMQQELAGGGQHTIKSFSRGRVRRDPRPLERERGKGEGMTTQHPTEDFDCPISLLLPPPSPPATPLPVPHSFPLPRGERERLPGPLPSSPEAGASTGPFTGFTWSSPVRNAARQIDVCKRPVAMSSRSCTNLV